jgi:hypothetical protein
MVHMTIGVPVIVFFIDMRMRHRHRTNAPLYQLFTIQVTKKNQTQQIIFLPKFSGDKEKQGICSCESLAWFVPLSEMPFPGFE